MPTLDIDIITAVHVYSSFDGMCLCLCVYETSYQRVHLEKALKLAATIGVELSPDTVEMVRLQEDPEALEALVSGGTHCLGDLAMVPCSRW